MIRKLIWTCSMLLFIGIFTVFSPLSPQDVFALGVGGYGSRGSGDLEFNEDYSDDSIWADLEIQGDAEYTGFGFIIDTAVAKDEVFNYRLEIAYESAEHSINQFQNLSTGSIYKKEDYGNFTINSTRFVFDNTFGFGIVRANRIRLWLGPQIRIGYLSGDYVYMDALKADFQGFIFGFGPAVGINFHIGEQYSLCAILGYRLSTFAGGIDKSTMGAGVPDNGDFDGSEETIFFNLIFLFRIDDSYLIPF